MRPGPGGFFGSIGLCFGVGQQLLLRLQGGGFALLDQGISLALGGSQPFFGFCLAVGRQAAGLGFSGLNLIEDFQHAFHHLTEKIGTAPAKK